MRSRLNNMFWVCCFCIVASTVQAEVKIGPVEGMTEAQAHQFWKLNWKKFADAYAKVGDQYYSNPLWNKRYPSSQMMTASEWVSENSKKVKVSLIAGLVKNKRITPPREEVIAGAYSLPEIKEGNWGQIHSVNVDKIMGKDSMLGSAVWLVDRVQIEKEIKEAEMKAKKILEEQARRERELREKERRQYSNNRNSGSGSNSQRYSRKKEEKRAPQLTSADFKEAIDHRYQHRRALIKKQDSFGREQVLLKGFDTTSVSAGKRWQGDSRKPIHVVIVGRYALPETKTTTSRFASSSRSSKVLVAVPIEAFKSNLTEEDFVKILANRKMTPEQFIYFARETMRENNEEESRTKILAQIEEEANGKVQLKAKPKVAKKDDDVEGKEPEAADKPVTEEELSLQERLAKMLDRKEGEPVTDKEQAKPDKEKADKPEKTEKPEKKEEAKAPEKEEGNSGLSLEERLRLLKKQKESEKK